MRGSFDHETGGFESARAVAGRHDADAARQPLRAAAGK